MVGIRYDDSQARSFSSQRSSHSAEISGYFARASGWLERYIHESITARQRLMQQYPQNPHLSDREHYARAELRDIEQEKPEYIALTSIFISIAVDVLE